MLHISANVLNTSYITKEYFLLRKLMDEYTEETRHKKICTKGKFFIIHCYILHIFTISLVSSFSFDATVSPSYGTSAHP